MVPIKNAKYSKLIPNVVITPASPKTNHAPITIVKTPAQIGTPAKGQLVFRCAGFNAHTTVHTPKININQLQNPPNVGTSKADNTNQAPNKTNNQVVQLGQCNPQISLFATNKSNLALLEVKMESRLKSHSN